MPVCRRKQSARLAATVELAAADVDLALGRLAERDDARVEAMDQGAEGHEVQRAARTDIQTIFHCNLFLTPVVNCDFQKRPSEPVVSPCSGNGSMPRCKRLGHPVERDMRKRCPFVAKKFNLPVAFVQEWTHQTQRSPLVLN